MQHARESHGYAGDDNGQGKVSREGRTQDGGKNSIIPQASLPKGSGDRGAYIQMCRFIHVCAHNYPDKHTYTGVDGRVS